MKCYAVIMAGGTGCRFWPLSREKEPKQLLNLSGEDYMINLTIRRIAKVIPLKQILIVTNKEQYEKMKHIVSGLIPEKNIIIEPFRRNTLACITYVGLYLRELYGDSVMCVFPSDHYIEKEGAFAKAVEEGIGIASLEDTLLTIGIQPDYPATGYGYIQYDRKGRTNDKKVLQFIEKPVYEKAEQYLNSGNYVWNSGMFIWRCSVILREIERYVPKVYEPLAQAFMIKEEALRKEAVFHAYENLPSISIDYGVMERASCIKVILGDLGWNDIGEWESLKVFHAQDLDGNVTVGEHLQLDSSRCILYSRGRMIATLGVHDLIVVETDDVVLICDRNRGQDIPFLIEEMKQQKLSQYL